MRYTETSGDLFAVDPSYTLAHCISADAKMGAGIAVEFTRHERGFDWNQWHVKSHHPKVGQAIFFQGDKWGVFNLVTKARYFDKPTYATLRAALADMRKQVEEMEIRKLAMPLIGCGLDRLGWELVHPLIIGTFEELDVEVLVVKR